MNEKSASLEMKQGFGATERKDIWWLEWVLLGSALAVFLSYGMWAALQGKNYIAGPYRSPFYPFDWHLGKISPALFIFWIPAFFRMTCYYMRKVYYRSYLTDPPSCGVRGVRGGYGGETGFPFILLNLHRYVVYLAVLLLIWHWKETLAAFYYQGKLGIGLGGVLLVLDSIFLTFYIFSCHTIRHMVGGGINQFSCSFCTRLRHKAWKTISRINYRHGFWAWVSLISIIIADVYIRLLAAGVITDINTWGLF